MKNDYLLDKEFLSKIDNDRNRIIYVKLISLDFDENPQEEILGRITSGSINIDGDSSVRRTCSLSLIANDLDINQYYWGLKTKFKCFIGLENKIDNSYPNPIWFPMGTYLITSFSCNEALANYTISISGKDKMCLLNGDIGGTITAISVDFGQMSEQQKDGSIIKTKLLLKDIIKEGVHEYAREPYHNIIINDLDEAALELLEYRGANPMYIAMDNRTQTVKQYILDPTTQYHYMKFNDETETSYTLVSIAVGEMEDDWYDHRIELGLDKTFNPLKLYPDENIEGNQIKDKDNYNTIIKIEYGEVIGYRLTTLTYAGDLIGQVGENFTSILDKIKTMLGDYEYFYNLEGQFVWQRRPTYINISWNNIQQNSEQESYAENAAYTSAVTYSFENSNLITAIQHQPDIQNVKNDYSIFGVRKTTSGTEIPVHLRYAIDQKPTYYRSWDGIIYSTKKVDQKELTEIAKEIASKEYLNTILSYSKQPLPEGLSNDWWDVWDWGEYYKELTGRYPEGEMSDYATDATALNLSNIFIVQSGQFPVEIYSVEGRIRPSTWGADRPCFLFDTLKIGDDQYLSYTGHNPFSWGGQNNSCHHKYDTYFMQKYRDVEAYNLAHPDDPKCEFHAYFYKPKIPPMTQAVIEARFELIGRSLANKVVDWREIIWRMADDYMKHSMKDPNHELNPNNFELVSDLTEEDFNKAIYYIRTEKYVQAEKYYPYTTYYTYNTEDNIFEKVTQELSQANFNYENIEPQNRIFYYYKETTPEYIQAKTFNSGTKYYKYVEYLDRMKAYNANYYPDGITGYEQYYTDIKSFWRDLYDPDYIDQYNVTYVNEFLLDIDGENYYWFQNQEKEAYQPGAIYYTSDLYGNWRAHSLTLITQDEFETHPDYYFLPIQGKSFYQTIDLTESDYIKDQYFIESKQYNKPFEICSEDNFNNNLTYYTLISENQQYIEDEKYMYDKNRIYYKKAEKKYYSEYEDNNITGESAEELKAADDAAVLKGESQTRQFPNRYWNKKIWDAPEKLDFWFDFLDTEGDLSKFSVKRIGHRPKAENNTNIKAIYYRETPNVIFVNNEAERDELKQTKQGYTFLSLNNNVNHLFTISSQGQSCKDKLNSLLYDFAICKQTITLTTIPIYYLQPNTRIFITDLESGINGEYIISRLGYNLNYNGTLSITASKAVDRIY